MFSWNFLSFRGKGCPFYPSANIQQLLGYGEIREYKPLQGNPIRFIRLSFGAGHDATRKAVLSNIRENMQIPYDEIAIKKPWIALDLTRERDFLEHELERQMEENEITLALDDLRPLIKKVHSNFGRAVGDFDFEAARERKMEVGLPMNVARLDEPPLEGSQERFAISCCINDMPGTIHSILDVLEGGKPHGSRKLMLNIDYLRTENLRLGGHYAFEVYGTYTPYSPQVPPDVNVSNVLGIVFYNLHARDNVITELNERMSQLKLSRIDKELMIRHLVEAYRGNALKPQEEAMDLVRLIEESLEAESVLAYGHAEPAGAMRREKLDPVRNCPISRVIGCPNYSPRPSSANRVGVRAYISVWNVPGALRTTLELLGRDLRDNATVS